MSSLKPIAIGHLPEVALQVASAVSVRITGATQVATKLLKAKHGTFLA
jgi:hypothetical protein